MKLYEISRWACSHVLIILVELMEAYVDIRKGIQSTIQLKYNVLRPKIQLKYEKRKLISITKCEFFTNGEKVEKMEEFVYLGSMFTRDEKCDSDIERRVNAGNIVNGALHTFMGRRVVSKNAQFAVHSGVLLPTLMYGSEIWVWQKKHTSRVNTVEMRALRNMISVKLRDKVRNEVIREECDVKDDVVTKIEKNMLRWFGYVERWNEDRIDKRHL
jgi:hypothetical protein